jgi:hypothetical protein
VPVVGGIAWEAWGPQAPFLMGVGFAVATLVVVQWMRVQAPVVEPGTSRAASTPVA